MRIPSREVLFIRQNRCPEFDLCKEPLPGGAKCFALPPRWRWAAPATPGQTKHSLP